MNTKELAIKTRLNGYSVIPLYGGNPDGENYKKPLIPWQEFQTRRASIQEIKSWRTETFGIVTGRLSNLFVLDIDTDAVIPPDGFNIKTRRGWHCYFRWDDRLDNKVTTKVRISADRDIRGEGGYVVAWDLERLTKPHKLPPVPQEIIDQLPDRPVLKESGQPVEQYRDSRWYEEAINGLTEGNRNDTFARLVGSFHSRGYSSDFIFDVLKSKAAEVSFPLSELQTVIQSIERYPVSSIEAAPGLAIDSFLANEEKVEWICSPIVARKSIGFVAGLPETGKTWAVIDLAVEAARGGMWLGKFKTEQCRVLFIDQERFKAETQRRFKAVISGKNILPQQLRENLFVRCGTSTRLNLQPSFDAFRKELADTRPDLVLVDSFVTIHTNEENNRKDIQEVLEKVKQLRTEFGCTFIFLDHENKGVFLDQREDEPPSAMRMAGSIAKPAAAEFILTVRKTDDNSFMAFHTKSTLSPTINPFGFKVRDIERGILVEGF